MIYREITFEESPVALPPHASAVGAINEAGEVVAVVGLFTTVHLDPLWIREDYRRHPTLLRRLWRATRNVLSGAGVRATIAVSNNPVVSRLCEWAGGYRADGQIYVIPTEEK